MKLKYANEDKSYDAGGWVLDYEFLVSIADKIRTLGFNTDLETVEAVLLTSVGEFGLLKRTIEELEME